jgi:hypothetical protein
LLDLDGEAPLVLALGENCGARSYNCDFTLIRAKDCEVVGAVGGMPSPGTSKNQGLFDLSAVSINGINSQTSAFYRFDGRAYKETESITCTSSGEIAPDVCVNNPL